MSPLRPLTFLPVLGVAFLLLGCASSETPRAPSPAPSDVQVEPADGAVQPGAPGTASRRLTPEETIRSVDLPHTAADVRFMQNMIHHHAQALVMARLVPDRTARDDLRLLARRIERSQTDEIALMQQWLRDRGEEAPEVDLGDEAGHGEHHHDHDPDAHREGHGEHGLMAGMLTPEQLDRLAAARGEEFDRLFLEFMIFHHEGALIMVEELFSVPGAAQGSEIYQFASHVDADQRIEIGRMEQLLAAYR